MQQFERALTAIRAGDLTRRVNCPHKHCHVHAIVSKFNDVVAHIEEIVSSVVQTYPVGNQVKLTCSSLTNDEGVWYALVSKFNLISSKCHDQLAEITRVAHAVAAGDLAQRMELVMDDVDGGQDLKHAMDEMGNYALINVCLDLVSGLIVCLVTKLDFYASETSRVIYQFSVQDQLNVNADATPPLHAATGAWGTLLYNVNTMTAALAADIRAIAEVCKAVARGDLTRKISMDVSEKKHCIFNERQEGSYMNA